MTRREDARPTHKGMPKSRLNPRAAPRNSARSVAMATSSISTHMTHTTGRRKVRAAQLGQVVAGGDAQLGGQRLDQHGHQVAGDHDPQQGVAELGPALRCWWRSCPGRRRRRWR